MAGSVYTYVKNTSSDNADAAVQTSQGVVAVGQSGLFTPGEVQAAAANGIVLQAGPAISPGPPPSGLAVSSGSAGNPNGAYKWAITFITAAGETKIGAEVSATLSNAQGNLTGIPTAPTLAGVIARNVYRTVAGGASGTEKLVGTITDNTTTVFTDNVADGSLGASAPTSDTAGVLSTGGSSATATVYVIAGTDGTAGGPGGTPLNSAAVAGASGAATGSVVPWTPNTNFAAGKVVSQNGQIWKSAWTHISGAVFNPNNWVALDLPYGPFVNPYPGKIGFATNMRSRTSAQQVATATRAAAVGATMVREVLSWTTIQPIDSSHYDWTGPDAVFTACANAGLTVLPVLTATPYWATLTTDYNVPPSNNSDYANFALAVWQRYGVGGAFWAANPGLTQLPFTWLELWNEPWLAVYEKYQTDTISIGAASAGTFTYSFTWQGRTYTTGSIAFNATPTTVQTALNAATSSGSSLPAGATWKVNTAGTLATSLSFSTQGTLEGPVTGQTVTPTGLTGATIVVTPGSAGVPPYQVDTIGLGAASAGSFTYSFTWQGKIYTTASIAYNASNVTLAAALNAATTSGGVGLPPNAPFAVSGGPLPATVTITAQNVLNGPITGQTITPTGLTGGTPATATIMAGVAYDVNTGFFHGDGTNAPTYPAGGGDPIKYAAMCVSAATLLRGSAAACKIQICGDPYSVDATGVGTGAWLSAVLAAQPTLISGNLFDGITIHPYVVAREHGPYEQDGQGIAGALLDPQGRFDRIRVSQRLLDTNGASGKEVWMTEMGWSTDAASGFSNSEDLQAQFTVSALRRVFREYGAARELNPATRVFIYTLDDYLSGPAGVLDNNTLKYPGAPSTPAIAKRVIPAIRKLIVASDGLRRLEDEMLADNPCFAMTLAEPSATLRDISGNMPLLNPLNATSGLVNSPATANAVPGPQYQGVPGTDLTFGGASLITDPLAYSMQCNTGAGGVLIDDHPALNIPTTQLSLEAWVKATAQGVGTIFRKFTQYQLTTTTAGGGYALTFGLFGGGAVYQTMTLTAGDRTSGVFALTFKWNGVTYTTAATLPFNATLAQVMAALNAATSSAGQTFPAGQLTGSGGPIGSGGSTITVTAVGTGTGAFSSIGVTGSTLAGGTTSPVFAAGTTGALGTNNLMTTNTSTEILTLGTVHHVVGVWDGQLMKIYVDGKRSVQTPIPVVGAIPASAQPMGIGYRGSAATDFLTGSISHIGIYPRPLSPRRIAEHYQAGVSAFALA